eukprot:jgi/Mesvir1/14643/Mv05313-RA.1
MGRIVVKPEQLAKIETPAEPPKPARKRTRRTKADPPTPEPMPSPAPPSPLPPPPPSASVVDKGADVEPFSIPNTLAESHIAFLRRKTDGAVHVGALLSAVGAKSEDVFGTDSSWVAPEKVVAAMKSDKRMRPLHESFSESIAVLEDMEGDKENDVPFRCVDFLKAKYGHGNFDATHLIQFGGAVYKEYKRTRGAEPPVRENNGYKLYFRRDIPVMQKAFDDWSLKLF